MTQNPAHTRVRRTILLAALYSFGAGLALHPLALNREITRNVDLWWHLNTGSWIAHHHAVPATDPFTLAGNGQTWVAYSWLFQLSLYGFYRELGLLGTVIYTLLLLLAIAVVLHRAIQARCASFSIPIVLTALALIAMIALYSTRPWLFTILLFTIELHLILTALADPSDDKGRRRLWLIPLLFVAWASLHIQFVYGLALLGLAALTQDLDIVARPGGLKIVRTPNPLGRVLWGVTGVSFLATLLNPYSWRIYWVILGLTKQRVPYRTISELTPPDFHSWDNYLIVLIALAGAFVLGRATRLRYRVFAALLLAAETAAYLHVARDEWMVVVTVVLLVAGNFGKGTSTGEALPRFERIAAIGLAVLFLFAVARARGISNARLEQQVASAYPAKATEIVLQRSFPGPLFNDLDWGGYLEWRLPHLKATIDSRMNVGGDELMERSFATWSCVGSWKADPNLAAANLVIGPAEACLSSALTSSPAYQLVYRDSVAVVFIRRGS